MSKAVSLLNPLNSDPLAKRVMKSNPRLKKRLDDVWDEGITAKRGSRAITPKVFGKNYEWPF